MLFRSAFLARSLARFIGAGFRNDETVIVIATKAHKRGVEELLLKEGFDLEAARNRGRFLTLDAEETLAKFMVDGSPDANRFEKVVGELLKEAGRQGKPIRAFGEMVVLLWQQGNGGAAIQLEELWNELGKKHAFCLLCAYPMSAFSDESHAEAFAHICNAHVRVVPAESYTGSSSVDEQSRTISLLQQKAAALEAEIARRKETEAALARRERELAELLERTVAERTAELKEIVSELETFSYRVSHDLRSPLRAMQGFAESLLNDYAQLLPEDGTESLKRIHRAAHRLDLLVKDILTYSKVTKGDIHLSPIPLETLLDDIIEQDPHLQAARGFITIERPLPIVWGHEAYITQCLTNLIGNALKFVEPGVTPKVIVRSETAGDKARISIIDNGVGIAPDNRRRIFQIFGRVYSENRYPGSGIGLAIVMKAVSRMGGEAGFESELGKGSTFWFTLRVANHGG